MGKQASGATTGVLQKKSGYNISLGVKICQKIEGNNLITFSTNYHSASRVLSETSGHQAWIRHPTPDLHTTAAETDVEDSYHRPTNTSQQVGTGSGQKSGHRIGCESSHKFSQESGHESGQDFRQDSSQESG